jgi:hypothetical protein
LSEEAQIAPSVREALEELEGDFDEVESEPDGAGGAFVRIKKLALGDKWHPGETDLSFQLLFNYPYAPVYPFYATPELQPADGGALPQALQRVNWRESEVTQVSLRANQWQPQHDTASGAVAQVRHWFRTNGSQ